MQTAERMAERRDSDTSCICKHFQIQPLLFKCCRKYERIINYYDVDHKYVQIEITESAIIENTVIVELIQKFHDAGFDILLDDFGSGYSSLASLNQMPFDTIKLDKSLVDYVGNEMVRSFLNLLYSLSRVLE